MVTYVLAISGRVNFAGGKSRMVTRAMNDISGERTFAAVVKVAKEKLIEDWPEATDVDLLSIDVLTVKNDR